MIELKDCPCCGEKAAMRESWEPLTVSGALQTWYVICTNQECELRTMKYLSPEKAARVWNRRVQA
jgi:hypothetical protein